MNKKLRITLRVSPLPGRSKTYFHRSILSFINGWLWRISEENYHTYRKLSPPKLVKASYSSRYCLSFRADTEYTSQLFYIKNVRYYYEEEV